LGVGLTIRWNLRIARRRATLDLLMAEQSQEALIRERTNFVRLREDGHLAKWAEPTETASDNAAVIRATLNRYELVAIGIKQSAFDRALYKMWCRTTLVKDWMACKPFVMQLRQNSRVPTYFCEFEDLARRWANKAEKPHV
jgi:hypothetical protein